MEVKIPKEIKEYKEKLGNTLTLRQITSLALGGLISLLIWYICRFFRIEEYIKPGIMITMTLFTLIGFSKFGGMNFEVFLLKYIENEFINNKFRYKKGDNNG